MNDKVIKDLANGVYEQLVDVSENGIPPVYDSMNDYLIDLWADLPWGYKASRKAMIMILNKPKFYNIAIKIMNKYDENMMIEFGLSINFIDEELRAYRC